MEREALTLLVDALRFPRQRTGLALLLAIQAGLIVAGGWVVVNGRAPVTGQAHVVISPGDDVASEYVSAYEPASDGSRVVTSLLGVPSATMTLSLMHIENKDSHERAYLLHASGLRSTWVTHDSLRLTGANGRALGSLTLADAPRETRLTLWPGEVADARATLTLSPDAPEEGLPVMVEYSVRDLEAGGR